MPHSDRLVIVNAVRSYFLRLRVADDGLEIFGEAINKATAVTRGSKIKGPYDVLFKIRQEKAQQKVIAGPMGGVNGIIWCIKKAKSEIESL